MSYKLSNAKNKYVLRKKTLIKSQSKNIEGKILKNKVKIFKIKQIKEYRTKHGKKSYK